jgi:hypothetical protein
MGLILAAVLLITTLGTRRTAPKPDEPSLASPLPATSAAAKVACEDV